MVNVWPGSTSLARIDQSTRLRLPVSVYLFLETSFLEPHDQLLTDGPHTWTRAMVTNVN